MVEVERSAPKLIGFSVCDDIRSEENGKITLIGYYGRSLRAASLPSLLPKLCFLGQFEVLPNGATLDLSLLSPTGTIVMSAAGLKILPLESATLIPPEYRLAQVFFQVVPMPLTEEGPYRVEFKFLNGPTIHSDFYVAVDPSLLKSPPLGQGS